MSLSKEIRTFVEEYAGVRPDYDPTLDSIDEKYTSPDAYQMLLAADELDAGRVYVPFSQWGSGGYKPYTSKEGRRIHDDLIERITKIK